jgi:hypothetical protein
MTYELIWLALGISVIALWQKHILLYLGAFISLLLIGFNFAETSWMMGIPVLCLAGFMMLKSIMYWFER